MTVSVYIANAVRAKRQDILIEVSKAELKPGLVLLCKSSIVKGLALSVPEPSCMLCNGTAAVLWLPAFRLRKIPKHVHGMVHKLYLSGKISELDFPGMEYFLSVPSGIAGTSGMAVTEVILL